jgi:hypothetical protein
MAFEIIPIAFAFSVVVLLVYIVVNPKQLVPIVKEVAPQQKTNPNDAEPNKNREWGSKIQWIVRD